MIKLCLIRRNEILLNIVEINSTLRGSTGNIARHLADMVIDEGGKALVCVPKGRHNRTGDEKTLMIGNQLSEDSHIILSRLTGLNGCFSYFATKIFLNKLKKIKPNLINFHNLHNCYINLPMLFNFVKKHNIPVVWTLHDTWSFTGQCPCFTMADCDKWKTGCHNCPQYKLYPKAYVDMTKLMWKLKKKWFTGVKNLTIVTPSQWLADLAKQSFLKDYPVKVINNGIDLSVFKPTDSDFKEIYNIGNKFVLLGVAAGWGKRKGLDAFIELSKRLDESKFQIVLVGTSEQIDKLLPANIISIHKTYNQAELAKIYSATDLFVNPTREENYPTVNMESIACGTPVVTFKTGGSPEIVDEKCGSVVAYNDVNALEKEILRIFEEKPFKTEDCLKRAESFDKNKRFAEYIELYKESVSL